MYSWMFANVYCSICAQRYASTCTCLVHPTQLTFIEMEWEGEAETMLGPIASAAAIATANAIILFFTSAACNSFVCVKSFAHLAVLLLASHTFLRSLWSVLQPDKELSVTGRGLTLKKTPYKTREQFNLFKQLYFGPCCRHRCRRRCCCYYWGSLCSWHVWNDFNRKIKYNMEWTCRFFWDRRRKTTRLECNKSFWVWGFVTRASNINMFIAQPSNEEKDARKTGRAWMIEEFSICINVNYDFRVCRNVQQKSPKIAANGQSLCQTIPYRFAANGFLPSIYSKSPFLPRNLLHFIYCYLWSKRSLSAWFR